MFLFDSKQYRNLIFRSDNQMRLGLLSALFASLAAMSAGTPVLAQITASAPLQEEVLWDWWYVYGGGPSPSREIIYIDALSVSVEKEVDHAAILSGNFDPKTKVPTYVEASGISVFEDPQKPARWTGRVRVKCDAQQIMFRESYQHYWDTDRSISVPATNWMDIGNDLKAKQISKFLCEPKQRNEKNMMLRADQTSDPLNVTWDVLWKDVPKPKFTTTKTREQIDAEYNATMAKAKGQIESAAAIAQSRVGDIKQEEAFIASVRKNFKAKGKKFSTLFYSTPGWDETKIITAWGAPIRSVWQGSTRVLVYPYQDTVYDVVQVPVDIIGCRAGSCGKVGETTQPSSVARTANCERYLYLRPGGTKPGPRLVDYAYACF
jgi:hypothetical protein